MLGVRILTDLIRIFSSCCLNAELKLVAVETRGATARTRSCGAWNARLLQSTNESIFVERAAPAATQRHRASEFLVMRHELVKNYVKKMPRERERCVRGRRREARSAFNFAPRRTSSDAV